VIEDMPADLNAYVHAKFTKNHFPGIALGVIRDGTLQFRAFGYADIESRAPITPDTLFAIGSMSKSFTALVTLKLAEQKRLSIHDPVGKFLPVPLRCRGDDVLVEHLLNHTSGLSDSHELQSAFAHTASSLPKLVPDESWDDIFTHLQGIDAWSFAPPGKEFHYWNMGYTLLSYIVEQVSACRFEEAVKEHVLEPLGMKRTCYTSRNVIPNEDVASAYLVADGKFTRSRWASGRTVAGAGGIVSSIADLTRYVRMFLDRGSLQGERVFSEMLIDSMQAPTVVTEPVSLIGTKRYGWGLEIASDFFSDNSVSHDGSVGNSNSKMSWIPERGCGVVALCNGSTSLGNIPDFALALAAGHDPYNHDLWRMERALERVYGVYEGFRGLLRCEVNADIGGVLRVRSAEGLQILLEPRQLNEDRLVCRIPNSSRLAEFVLHSDHVDLAVDRTLVRKFGPESD